MATWKAGWDARRVVLPSAHSPEIPNPVSAQPTDPGEAGVPPGIEAVGVAHSYDRQPALRELSLAVADGEFCTLLGPSGSGKTTLLRIFAGLLTPSHGQVRIKGRDVTGLSVQNRSVGFVFQHYALFPHLTVAENVAYPLKIRRYKKADRARLVAEMLEFVDLEGLAHRHPAQLSGGQQQRVAIARALIFKPEVLLLDEPLGALDRRLRQQLGTELRRIQKEYSTTAIYVTHDQEEALLLSDTVAVINEGAVQQVGSPRTLYTRPVDRFVATFLGDTNILTGQVQRVDRRLGTTEIEWNGVRIDCRGEFAGDRGRLASLSIRPEDVWIAGTDADRPAHDGGERGRFVLGPATVVDWIFLGGRFRVFLRLADDTELVAEIPADHTPPDIGSTVSVGWLVGTPAAISD